MVPSCNYYERYRDVELSLELMGTGATRTLYTLTVRETGTRRLMFDVRIEAALDELMARALRANQSTDHELRDVSLSYARYIVDNGAYRYAPHFHLQVGESVETLEPLGR